MSVININPFENITEVNLEDHINESPLKNFKLSKKLFEKENDNLLNLDNWEIQHWKNVFTNKLFSLERDFGYAMFYFSKGIPDDEWFISPGHNGKSVQYFPHFKEVHHSNFFNFTFFVDLFFLKIFTLYETIGHLIFKAYDLKIDDINSRNQISFVNAVFKIKSLNFLLHKALLKVTYSSDFKSAKKIRNDIAHNLPPYIISSGVKHIDGVTHFGIGDYTKSKEIKSVMIGALTSVKATLEVLEKHLIP